MAEAASLIASWLTPSSLFIFVNLVIGTIAITSRFGNKNAVQTPSLFNRVTSFNLSSLTHPETHYVNSENPVQLLRTPSLLDRVRSFNLSFRNHAETETQHDVQPESEPEKPELVRTPSLLDRVRSSNLSFRKHAETETQDDVEPESEAEAEKPELVRSPSLLERIQCINFSSLYKSEDRDSGKAELRKSGSERGIDREWEEVESRRPQTARAVETTSSWKEDEEVDAKADDFINRFRKQLRLQRIDSLLRYRDTLAQKM